MAKSMTADPAPIEPAATMDQLRAATGWSDETIQAAIRQGVLPGTAFKVEGSSRYVYTVPGPALRAWQDDPRRFGPVERPAPQPLIRPVRRTG